jgi:hypothetical protein
MGAKRRGGFLNQEAYTMEAKHTLMEKYEIWRYV